MRVGQVDPEVVGGVRRAGDRVVDEYVTAPATRRNP